MLLIFSSLWSQVVPTLEQDLSFTFSTSMRTVRSKDPAETIPIGFDFGGRLLPGETLTGLPVIFLRFYSGIPDANAPAMLSGSPAIIGSVVLQMLVGGVENSRYETEARCMTSSGRVIAVGGIFTVIDAALQ